MKPIKIKSQYVHAIWERDHLSKIRGLNDAFGISRELSAYKGVESIVAKGEYKGKKITDLIKEKHFELMGNDPNDQLLRVAYMDSKEDLSIQVHMNKKQAEEVDDYEKSESWYILEAEEGATLTAGINIEDKNEIKKAILNNELDKYLIKHEIKEGDFIMIPANMLHANGANMLVVEFGSFGGITYRLYDYGRDRKLNLEEGLEVLNPSLKTKVNHHPLPINPTNKIEKGIDCQLFSVDIIDIKDELEIGDMGYYYELVNVKGTCDILSEEKYHLNYTDCLFVPASCKKIKVIGNCRLLMAHYKYD